MTILVVDDNPLVRQVVRAMLAARGYVVLDAEDGFKALDLFSAQGVDAALVDVDMPAMNGPDLCRALRERAVALGRPVLLWLMTGVMRPELFDHVDVLGVIPKPFTTAELVGRIEREWAPATV